MVLCIPISCLYHILCISIFYKVPNPPLPNHDPFQISGIVLWYVHRYSIYMNSRILIVIFYTLDYYLEILSNIRSDWRWLELNLEAILYFLTLAIWKCNILALSNIKYSKINSFAFQENQIKSISFPQVTATCRPTQHPHSVQTPRQSAQPPLLHSSTFLPLCQDWILLTFTLWLEA